ncbi:MAG: hypothetical protein ABIH59_02610 [archaeon]
MESELQSEYIEIRLKKIELSRIFRRCWDLLDKDTQEMLLISELVEGVKNV